MNFYIEQIAYHRNGICGAPFHIVIFRDQEAGPMVGIVFDEPYHVAVLKVDKLSQGDIAFGSNSWCGDQYEAALRRAIRQGGDQ